MKKSSAPAHPTKDPATQPVPVESSTRPGLVHSVDLEARTCSCEARIELCRHRRRALIRRRKQLMRLEETYRHEILDSEERAELWDLILRLRRFFYR